MAELRRIWVLLYFGLLNLLMGYGTVPELVVVPGFNAPLPSFAQAYTSVVGPLADVGETDLARIAECEAAALRALIDASPI